MRRHVRGARARVTADVLRYMVKLASSNEYFYSSTHALPPYLTLLLNRTRSFPLSYITHFFSYHQQIKITQERAQARRGRTRRCRRRQLGGTNRRAKGVGCCRGQMTTAAHLIRCPGSTVILISWSWLLRAASSSQRSRILRR